MTARFAYQLISRDPGSSARLGRIETAHGTIETPVFMPVGTQGTVKALTNEMLEQAGATVILGNTYHLFLRPGHDVINRLGGLHRFTSWDRAILTDSGGFQVFSLGDLRKISEEGVEFQSQLDGSRHVLSPERAIDIQVALGSDIVMAFDECTPFPATFAEAESSLQLTERWARRCRTRFDQFLSSGGSDIDVVNRNQALFGISQGSVFRDLRRQSVEGLLEIGFDGYAIGGLSVGEDKDSMFDVIASTAPLLPEDKPRYLMGVGTPEDLVESVRLGIDMFDCVMPTRNARNGQLFTRFGRLNVKNARYKEDSRPIDESCGCPVCGRYSRAYLRHLYMSAEILGSTLSTLHNVCFYLDTMLRMRQAISLGAFDEFHKTFLSDLARGQD